MPPDRPDTLSYRSPTTLDGVRVKPGERLYCRARLVDPRRMVTVLREYRTTRSWGDGRLVALWEVDPGDGLSPFVVEPWMLSRQPIRVVLDALRDGAFVIRDAE